VDTIIVCDDCNAHYCIDGGKIYPIKFPKWYSNPALPFGLFFCRLILNGVILIFAPLEPIQNEFAKGIVSVIFTICMVGICLGRAVYFIQGKVVMQKV